MGYFEKDEHLTHPAQILFLPGADDIVTAKNI